MDGKVAVIQQTPTEGGTRSTWVNHQGRCGYEIRQTAWGKSAEMCGNPVGSWQRDAEMSMRWEGCGKANSKRLNGLLNARKSSRTILMTSREHSTLLVSHAFKCWAESGLCLTLPLHPSESQG